MSVHVSVIEKKLMIFITYFMMKSNHWCIQGKKKEIIITFVPESDIRMLQYRQKVP